MSNITNGISVFIIRHKETGRQWKTDKGKSQWAKSGHAKNAWGQARRVHRDDSEIHELDNGRYWDEYPRFDDQDVYELVELKTDLGEYIKELEDELAIAKAFFADSGWPTKEDVGL